MCNFDIDWSQFWPGMIATFVGFVLALMGQGALEYLKKRKDSKELKSHIAEELCSIIVDLKILKNTSLDIQPLKIPVWNALINAGQVALLDSQIREQLFRVYNTIHEFNSWHLVQTNYYFEKGKYNDLLINELSELKELLCEDNSNSNRSIVNILRILKHK